MADEKKDSKSKGKKTLRIVGWVLGILLLLIVLLPFALYIPWVQNIVKDWACEWASKETGMDISVGRILIKWPLDVSVDDVLILDENRDTMLVAENFTASVQAKPLLDLTVAVDEAQLTKARYRMVTADSSMVLAARVDECKVSGINLDLKHNEVGLAEAALRGGDVDLTYLPHKVVHEADTAASDPWHIIANHVTLDDVNYTMQMLPTIDKMTAYIPHGELHGGVVDTGARTVDAQKLQLDSADVRYTYPSAKYAEQYSRDHPLPPDTLPPNPADSIPWTIKADSLRINGGHAVYAQRDVQPRGSHSVDMDYLEVSDINVAIDDFYSCGDELTVPVKSLTARERSGLQIEQGSGTLSMNQVGIDVDKLHVKTMMSDINLDAHIDHDLLENKPGGNMAVTTDSRVALQEVSKIFPEYSDVLRDIPQVEPVKLQGRVAGNTQQLQLRDFTAELPRYAKATVTGNIYNPMDPDHLAGEVDLDARFDNINFIKPSLMDKAMQRQVNLPPMALKGHAKLAGDEVSGNMTMKLANGDMVGRGSFNMRSLDYDVDATFNRFPVKAILPLSETSDLTAHVRARGHGLDFMQNNTAIDASIDLQGVNYNNALYRNLKADVKLNGGNFTGRVSSSNANCDVDVNMDGTIRGDHYVVNARGVVNDLDLAALNLYDGACAGNGRFELEADVDTRNHKYNADVRLHDFKWNLDGDILEAEEATATLASDPQSTSLTFDNEDNHLTFNSACGVEDITKHLQRVADIAQYQIDHRSLNIDTLKQALPQFNMNMRMGTDGLLQRYLQKYDVDFREANIEMRNDSNIFVDGYVNALSVGDTSIDTLTFKATEWNKYLAFKAHMGNRPGTWDDYAQVSVEGGVKGSTVDFLLKHQNIKGEVGYRLGCNATLNESEVAMRLFPENPVIGYRQWQLNEDNYVNLDYRTRMLDANVELAADDSKLKLTTKREPGATTEDILLNVENLRIEEWTQFMPSLPPMSGRLNADMDITFDGRNVEGKGDLNLKDFVYDGVREGDLAFTATYEIDPATASTRINADMLLDGAKVAVAYGSLNDSTSASPLNMTLSLDRFPLRKVQAFIPGKLVSLRGYLNGDLTLTGTSDNPRLNGFVVGDSASVRLPRYGAELRLDTQRLPITDNVVKFNNYNLLGINDKPVVMNGKVDMSDISNPVIDLTMIGKNVQIIGSEQRQYSDIFGKGFADISATVRSRNNNMDIRADVTMLPGSNITYVMKEEVSTLTQQVDENMITFVNFNDSTSTTPVLITANESYATSILANININQGAKINAYLSEDGKDRVTIDGVGHLKYSLDFAGKDNLNGNYTIESGNLRYSPPLLSQKNFDINSGSSLTWTGDMLNPQLNIKATEKVRTSVSSGDNSAAHPVDFLITATVGGTLSNMQLDFDMSTESDMSIQNELQSMSDVQRSQAAINVLLYNTYTGANTTGGVSSLNANSALFSFLQSQLNDWAAKSLKGVDLSFGINQYEGQRNSGTQTSYSYRLAKTLFNDRFKIVVGGEYSTDATADENFSQNLINDISFEYYLNERGSKYLRLFRHTGFESVLEGQITETGIGFVMKRKVGSLYDLFNLHRQRDVTADSLEAQSRAEKALVKAAEDATEAADTIPANENTPQ